MINSAEEAAEDTIATCERHISSCGIAAACKDCVTIAIADARKSGYEDGCREVWKIITEELEKWLAAYPTNIFIEPPVGQHGTTVDACSARMGRHMAKSLIEFCHYAQEVKDVPRL